MKKVYWIVGVLTLTWVIYAKSISNHGDLNRKEASLNASDQEETISISGAFALYPMTIKWGEGFKTIHPNVRFEISAGGAGKGISDVLGGLVDLGAVSREIYPEELDRGAFPLAVCIDAVVPTVNASNRDLKEILAKGLKRKDFEAIFVLNDIKDWKELGFTLGLPIHVYTRSDAAGAAETWAGYLRSRQEDLQGTGVFGDPGLLQAIQRDPGGIGFNNISYVYDIKSRQHQAGIEVIPIDMNENGKIDREENYYNNLDEIVKAIKEGKYPSPPARELYYVSKKKPDRKIVLDFLDWVLTEGQKELDAAGYIPLEETKVHNELNKIHFVAQTNKYPL